MGLWRGVDSGPKGSLYYFKWAPECIEAVQLVPLAIHQINLRHKLLCKLAPMCPGFTAEVVDDTHCIVREYRYSPARTPFPEAEAAALVAAGGAGVVDRQSGSLSSSPSSSFGYELLRFMSGAVQQVRLTPSWMAVIALGIGSLLQPVATACLLWTPTALLHVLH